MTFSALAVLAACATRDEDIASFDPVADGGSTADDGSSEEIDTTPSRDAAPSWSGCNDHGWCETDLPDPNLTLVDIWPFVGRAFAVGQSDTLGTKVIEWTEATQAWSYVDDNSQNAYGGGEYAGKMYAPSENELYFTTAPGIVVHGTRETPSSPFKWQSTRLPYDGPVYADRDPARAWRVWLPGYDPTRYATALGVTGTSAKDVYAWYGNRIFHATWPTGDGGGPTWVAEFVTEDPSGAAGESFYIFNASASSDEVWFVGGHGPSDIATGFSGCPTLFRRTAAGYSTVLDFAYSNDDSIVNCSTKPGTIQPVEVAEFPGYGVFEIPRQLNGWATAVVPVGPGAVLVNVHNDLVWYYVDIISDIARINWVFDVEPPVPFGLALIHSVARVDDRLWFSGHGMVFGSKIVPEAWKQSRPAEALEMTSVAMRKRYLDEPLYQVRGTSSKNLWAVGNRYALHKKTP